MNRFGRPALAALSGLSLLLVLIGAPRTAGGQTVVLPPNIKTAADASPHRATIQRYVDAAVKRLTSENADEQSKGRNALIDGASVVTRVGGGGAGGPSASASYLDAYAAAAARSLAPLAAHADMRVRLNAAIAAARIAEKANNLRLADLAVKFMNDKTPAVSLWGVKAAAAMVPAAVATPGNNPIMPALVQTVRRNPLGPVVLEVYHALVANIFTARPNERPSPAQIKAIIPTMLGVYRQRVNAYARGAVPVDPSVDNVAAKYLTFSLVWSQMTPAQQTQVVQSISDLLGYAGQYAELMADDERQPLIPIFQRTGAALQVVGDSMSLPAVSKAARDVQGITTGMDGTEVRTRTDAVALALQQAPQFKGIKPPAAINMLGGDPGAGAATDPARTDAPPGADGAANPKSGFDGKGGAADAPKKPAPPRQLPPVRRAPRPGPPAAAPPAGTGRPAQNVPGTPPAGQAPARGTNGAAPARAPAPSQGAPQNNAPQ